MNFINDEWTIEKIKVGFERFKAQNGRLPTGPEIDQLDYLPSARQIQRKFGGLEKLRSELGYEYTHFGKGKYRSEIASRINVKGRQVEISLEKILKEKFHEVFVHTEKVFDDSKNRVDFYVYCPDGNFGIDVFYTGTMRDLQKNVNIKIDKYQNFTHRLYLVVANNDFEQQELNGYMVSKKKALPQDSTIVTLDTLFEIMKNKRSYPDPFITK
ncbi:MAG: hypothetical protein RLZZ347_28 [Candidatus Parcubacteria bacterium]|jgi:hypothetical protein